MKNSWAPAPAVFSAICSIAHTGPLSCSSSDHAHPHPSQDLQELAKSAPPSSLFVLILYHLESSVLRIGRSGISRVPGGSVPGPKYFKPAHIPCPSPPAPDFGSLQWQQLPLIPRERKAGLVPGGYESAFCGREEKTSRNAQSMTDIGSSHA